MVVGTSVGKIITYDAVSGDREENSFQAAGPEQSITKLISLQSIPDSDVFLMTVDDQEIFVYDFEKADTKEVDFGDDGQDFVGNKIASIQVSSNNKFFMIGIPSKRALGWFGLNRVHFQTRPLKWITKVSSSLSLSLNSFVQH